jgi:NDP-sugar pyrophosphorylase family protein
MFENVKTSSLYECKVDFLVETFKNSMYPWDILPKIKDLILKIISDKPEGYTEISKDVIVAKNVKIADSATIIGPCVIGENTEIRPGAYIRGNVISGKNCVIGNSSEIKNAILLDFVQVPHYNYVGDSILGNHAHMGAGSICSNLKSGGSEVVIHADAEIRTGLRKVGAFLGDNADVGCGSVLNPGTVIGKRSVIYPLSAVRGVIAADTILKSHGVCVNKREIH